MYKQKTNKNQRNGNKNKNKNNCMDISRDKLSRLNLKRCTDGLLGLVLWHSKHFSLFNAKFSLSLSLYIYIYIYI